MTGFHLDAFRNNDDVDVTDDDDDDNEDDEDCVCVTGMDERSLQKVTRSHLDAFRNVLLLNSLKRTESAPAIDEDFRRKVFERNHAPPINLTRGLRFQVSCPTRSQPAVACCGIIPVLYICVFGLSLLM